MPVRLDGYMHMYIVRDLINGMNQHNSYGFKHAATCVYHMDLDVEGASTQDVFLLITASCIMTRVI